ncbi:hypothetical protein [Pseudoduganella albidiflava]|uniref:Uncharacterized protein n=1 Tax=Pseudoduganella albidiflava TaxID=321983 RepID=A0A411X322_9BURK|nr:hypothetical protein [Pseudoduganella albidiflava]QBI03397.1 hypothetical protein EYF70_23150 [Pseudoduganella albidiflava]GGY49710.1 hypothetical protein GCM10007387_34830 [Pseudoduganella albidiflava]
MENKWWEYYAVRYFVGTIVGALIIAFLRDHPGSIYVSKLSLGEAKEVTFLGVGLVAALGFAFCYVASAPILLIHAARAHIRWSEVANKWLPSSTCTVVGIALSGAAIWQILPHWIAAVIAFVIGTQISLIFLALFTKFSVVESFYRSLANARSKSMKQKDEPYSPGVEYVTSYRHLREHGNAFAIVVLEGVLGAALYHVPSIVSAMYFIGIWIVPATFAWLIGSVLESRFASNPLP